MKQHFLTTYFQYKTAQTLMNRLDHECQAFQTAMVSETDKTYPLFIMNENSESKNTIVTESKPSVPSKNLLEKAQKHCEEAIAAKVDGKWGFDSWNYFAGSNHCKRKAKEDLKEANKLLKSSPLSKPKILGFYEACFVKAYSSNRKTGHREECTNALDMRKGNPESKGLKKNRIFQVIDHVYQIFLDPKEGKLSQPISFDPAELEPQIPQVDTQEQKDNVKALGTPEERPR